MALAGKGRRDKEEKGKDTREKLPSEKMCSSILFSPPLPTVRPKNGIKEGRGGEKGEKRRGRRIGRGARRSELSERTPPFFLSPLSTFSQRIKE